MEILNNDLPSMEGLGLVDDLPVKAELPSIPQEMLTKQLHYTCGQIVYHLNQVQEPSDVLNESVHTFLNHQVTRWMEVCVRTEGNINISSFPEWAKVRIVNIVHSHSYSVSCSFR
jgi:hypothetical protein